MDKLWKRPQIFANYSSLFMSSVLYSIHQPGNWRYPSSESRMTMSTEQPVRYRLSNNEANCWISSYFVFIFMVIKFYNPVYWCLFSQSVMFHEGPVGSKTHYWLLLTIFPRGQAPAGSPTSAADVKISMCIQISTIWNETSVTTHFKKLTTGNNVFIVSVIVWSNCHILQFLPQTFNVSALLLDDAFSKCVVTEVVLLSVVAFKTLKFHTVV